VSLTNTLDEVLRDAVGDDRVPGIVAMVADRDGEIYSGAFGKRSRDSDEPMTMDTVHWIASMTKAVTAAGVMRLVEEGELDLDAPASRWLPMLADVAVLEGFDGDGKPQLRAPKSEITTRQLLTHSAGFGYEMWDGDIARYQEVTGLPGIIACANDSLKMPLLADPGTRWRYGIGIDLSGRIAEEITGKKISEHLRSEVLGPLGMTSTSFKLSEDQRGRLATMHLRDADGNLAAADLIIEQEPEFEMSGGALYSTAGDYLNFNRMLLGGGQLDGTRVLREDTVAQMCSNQMGDLRVQPLVTVMPHMTGDCDIFSGVPMGWGLSNMINMEDCPTGRRAGSCAWAGLSNSYYWIDPTSGITGVYFSQILPFMDTESYPAFERFETAVYKALA
jgi:CubicO group peptidase (beta-lactamase class C family)